MIQLRASKKPEPRPEGLKVLIGAYLTGLILFSATAFYLRPLSDDVSLTPALGGALVVLGLSELVIAAVASRIRATKKVTRDLPANDRRRIQGYIQEKLLHAPMAEGFGLFGAVALMLTGHLYFLAAPILAAWILVRLLPKPGEIEALSHAIAPGASTHSGVIEP